MVIGEGDVSMDIFYIFQLHTSPLKVFFSDISVSRGVVLLIFSWMILRWNDDHVISSIIILVTYFSINLLFRGLSDSF